MHGLAKECGYQEKAISLHRLQNLQGEDDDVNKMSAVHIMLHQLLHQKEVLPIHMVAHFNFQQNRKVKLALVCACVLMFTEQKQSGNR